MSYTGATSSRVRKTWKKFFLDSSKKSKKLEDAKKDGEVVDLLKSLDVQDTVLSKKESFTEEALIMNNSRRSAAPSPSPHSSMFDN